jgi:hypothetical protein
MWIAELAPDALEEASGNLVVVTLRGRHGGFSGPHPVKRVPGRYFTG